MYSDVATQRVQQSAEGLQEEVCLFKNHEATLLVQVAAIFVGSTKNIQIDFQAC